MFEFSLHVNAISWNLHTFYMTCVYSGFCYVEANSYTFSFFVIFSVIVHKMISKSVLNLEFALNLGKKNSMTCEKFRKTEGKKYIEIKKETGVQI